MEIVKAFNSNELHTDIVIKGTTENPLFRASDIGNILEMSNIHASLKEFDDTEFESIKYLEKVKEIGREMLYTLSKITKK